MRVASQITHLLAESRKKPTGQLSQELWSRQTAQLRVGSHPPMQRGVSSVVKYPSHEDAQTNTGVSSEEYTGMLNSPVPQAEHDAAFVQSKQLWRGVQGMQLGVSPSLSKVPPGHDATQSVMAEFLSYTGLKPAAHNVQDVAVTLQLAHFGSHASQLPPELINC